MRLARLPELAPCVEAVLASSDSPAEERALCENLSWEERLGEQRLRRYAEAFNGRIAGRVGDIRSGQLRYAQECLETDVDSRDIPDTFADVNDANAWRDIEPNLFLLRIESLNFLNGSGVDELELRRALQGQLEQQKKEQILMRVCETWNAARDRRPAYATTAIAVEEVFEEAGDDWANALRDELGLGQFSPPVGGEPITVLLMRYRVEEVLADKTSGRSGFAIPTVIDGRLNPFFFPTPTPGPGSDAAQYEVGRALNLRPLTNQSDYRMGLELVHSRIKYQPRHFDRLGLIDRPLNVDLAAQRVFHLDWLRLYSGRDDFGSPP